MIEEIKVKFIESKTVHRIINFVKVSDEEWESYLNSLGPKEEITFTGKFEKPETQKK
uniref:Uncharacterized protein n=1 Tax=viral metagenome TaxID=1070528 RepID=A0A6M3K601_9ZZZZ